MKRALPLVAVTVLLLSGCGDDDGEARVETAREPEPMAAEMARGARITLRDSEFGSMLFGRRRQAIYVFERDPKGRSACYGECAAAWPPVLTRGKPRAGRGVRPRLLGSVRRRGGRSQVTYAGRPLYFYAHEGPGQVLCHNVDLNGGLWWVVGPDGRPRP